MISPARPSAAATSTVIAGGTPVIAVYGPVAGFTITNPVSAVDQGVAAAEPLYVNISGAASIVADGTTFALQPGQSYSSSATLFGDVSVNAATNGHQFSAVAWYIEVPYPPTPLPGSYPPGGPTTLLQTLAAYLYQQYNDDADLQAFVNAYNALSQGYVDWFNQIGLPIYTGSGISGPLLDWVATGLYGLERPTFAPVFRGLTLGQYNTYRFNQLRYNYGLRPAFPTVTPTTDDIYKRVLTWHFYKGDGKVFSVEWLKRRIMRFLIGVNGTSPAIDNTYPISVSFGAGGVVYINILRGTRVITGGSFYNRNRYNTIRYNYGTSVFTPSAVFALAPTFQQAVLAGVLELPFQFTFIVTVV